MRTPGLNEQLRQELLAMVKQGQTVRAEQLVVATSVAAACVGHFSRSAIADD